jgi:hypothetical protein
LCGARTLQQLIEILRLPVQWAGRKRSEQQHDKQRAPNK